MKNTLEYNIYIKPHIPGSLTTITTITIRMPAKIKYSVLEKATINNLGQGDCWSVQISPEIRTWLAHTYSYGIDYEEVNQLKGMWVNVTPEVLVMIKLKWS